VLLDVHHGAFRARNVTEPAGSFIQTASGRRVDPFAPRPEDLDVEDIAVALSNQCRFGGHIRAFYSVAQHALIVSQLVEEHGGDAVDCLWGLLHDASEAYLLDLPHPIKHRSELGRLYRAAESGLQAAICERFGLPADPPEGLKALDRALLATERRALAQEAWHWPELEDVAPLELEIEPLAPDAAAAVFLERYAELERRRNGA
jgi:uncharacterized protein